MKLELQQNLRPELRLKMSPQLIQRIEILQLSALDLQEMVENELMENETLEVEEPVEEAGLAKEEEKELPDEEAAFEQDIERFSALAEAEERTGSAAGRNRLSGEEDPKLEAMKNTASRSITLQEHLKKQLDLSDADPRIRKIAEQIVFNINDRGYLLYPLEEIRLSLEDEATMEEMEAALAVVQSLEPRGVGARTLQECLLLQLDESRPHYGIIRRIISDCVEDVSKNRLPKVARDLGVSLTTLQDALQEVAHLDPIPGRSFRNDAIPYVKPDVVVELIDGKYEIRMEDTYFPRLGLSKAYLEMCRGKDIDPKLKKHLQSKIESAKWLIESIVQRKSTLLRVVTEIIEHQKDFLDHGSKMLKPLKMQDIADRIGIHVSTVSRAIADKYVQTHRGIFPLKFFFTGATRSDDGSFESRLGVKQMVKEIIDTEDKVNPLSDQDIVDKLKAQGINIARRTVTKYRKALKVSSSRERRVY